MKPLTARQLERFVLARGWTLASVAGSHHKYRKPGCRNIVIPFHGSSDLAPGLQQSIMREAGITRAEIERRTP